MEKKVDIDSAHDVANPKELPAELSDSIKTPLMCFWIFLAMICWM